MKLLRHQRRSLARKLRRRATRYARLGYVVKSAICSAMADRFDDPRDALPPYFNPDGN